MAKIYLKRILAGQMYLYEVPLKWRHEVETLLAASER